MASRDFVSTRSDIRTGPLICFFTILLPLECAFFIFCVVGNSSHNQLCTATNVTSESVQLENDKCFSRLKESLGNVSKLYEYGLDELDGWICIMFFVQFVILIVPALVWISLVNRQVDDAFDPFQAERIEENGDWHFVNVRCVLNVSKQCLDKGADTLSLKLECSCSSRSLVSLLRDEVLNVLAIGIRFWLSWLLIYNKNWGLYRTHDLGTKEFKFSSDDSWTSLDDRISEDYSCKCIFNVMYSIEILGIYLLNAILSLVYIAHLYQRIGQNFDHSRTYCFVKRIIHPGQTLEDVEMPNSPDAGDWFYMRCLSDQADEGFYIYITKQSQTTVEPSQHSPIERF